MAIKGNIGQQPKAILSTDTVMYGTTADRYYVGAFSFYNTSAATITVSLYVSPNATSLSGTLVGAVTVAAGGVSDALSMIGHGFSGLDNIIAVASAVGVNSLITTTEYTGGD